MDILQDLNSAQKEAVLHMDGPLLVVAGAGSGKTKVLTHRIVHLMQQGVSPGSILAVTFTNKAAREMQERIQRLLFSSAADNKDVNFTAKISSNLPWVGTFHALGVYTLRENGRHIDIAPNFTIFDEDDAQATIRQIIKMLKLDNKQFQPGRVRNIISKLKYDVLGKESEDFSDKYPAMLKKVFDLYVQELRTSNALDFDDLLIKTVDLLSIAEVLGTYRKRWQYILVDEYQDTNHIQYNLVKLLAGEAGNIMAVGDVDQAIYSWRGASIKNILSFEKDWPGTRVITLEQNYRSTEVILEAANILIKKNNQRKKKNLWTEQKGGNPISLVVTEDEKQEATFVSTETEKLTQAGASLGEVAVLYRTNAQSRAIEEAFIRKGISYRLVGGTRFYERKEVKDILAYMRLAVNSDDAVSRRRIINTPPRGIGKVLAEKYFNRAELSEKEQEKIKRFEGVLACIREVLSTHAPKEVLETILKESGYEDYVRDGTSEGEDRWANTLELLSVAEGYAQEVPPRGVIRFLEEMALLSDADGVEKERSAVHMMTVHAAKGLEFDTIFIVGLEEGVFPHSLSLTSSLEMEEERRLCYVAFTRAKVRLYLSMARVRTLYGEKTWSDPSRFLRDMPEYLLKAPVAFGLNDDENIVGYDT